MSDALSTLRLLQVADSAFPSGAFAFSNDLETLHAEGSLADADALEVFLRHQVLPRWFQFDRWFLLRARESASGPAALAALDESCHTRTAVRALAEASRRTGRSSLMVHVRMGTPGAADYLARVNGGIARAPVEAAARLDVPRIG